MFPKNKKLLPLATFIFVVMTYFCRNWLGEDALSPLWLLGLLAFVASFFITDLLSDVDISDTGKKQWSIIFLLIMILPFADMFDETQHWDWFGRLFIFFFLLALFYEKIKTKLKYLMGLVLALCIYIVALFPTEYQEEREKIIQKQTFHVSGSLPVDKLTINVPRGRISMTTYFLEVNQVQFQCLNNDETDGHEMG